MVQQAIENGSGDCFIDATEASSPGIERDAGDDDWHTSTQVVDELEGQVGCALVHRGVAGFINDQYAEIAERAGESRQSSRNICGTRWVKPIEGWSE